MANVGAIGDVVSLRSLIDDKWMNWLFISTLGFVGSQLDVHWLVTFSIRFWVESALRSRIDLATVSLLLLSEEFLGKMISFFSELMDLLLELTHCNMHLFNFFLWHTWL